MIVRITGEYSKYELEQEIAKVMSEEVAHGNYCRDIRYTVTPAKILGRNAEVEDTTEFYYSALLMFEARAEDGKV